MTERKVSTLRRLTFSNYPWKVTKKEKKEEKEKEGDHSQPRL
jgi:hypothetical protein